MNVVLPSNFKLKLHSVKRQPYAGWQCGIGRFMRQVMANMREKCTLRFYLVHNLQRLLNGGMRGMRLIAKRIQKEDVETAQLVQGFSRHLAVISEGGGRSEKKTNNRCLAMDDCQRLKACAEQFNRAFNRMEFDLGQSAKFIHRLKNIAEHVAQKFAGARHGIKRKFARLVLIR